MRVTHQMLNQAAIDGMQATLRRLADIQTQAVTTKRLVLPEDDPFATEQALNFRADIASGEAILHNVDLSLDWLNTTDGALSDLTTLLTRAESLALKGSSENLGPDERQSLATELEGLIEQAVSIGNSSCGDDFLFSGFEINTQPFEVVRDPISDQITAVTYTGDDGQILREVEKGIDVSINVPGDPVFSNIFTSLIDLRDALAADPFVVDDVTTALTGVKSRLDDVLDVQASIGTKIRRLETVAERTQAHQTSLKELLSKAEDADMAQVVTDLSQQQFIYQSALAVNAQILRLSLLDFLD